MDDKSAGDELLISQLEHRSHEAFLARDTEALDRILADDFIFTDPEGNLVTKADWIAEIGSGDLTFEAIHTDDLQIRIYGDAAVTFGRVTMKGRSTKEGDFHASYCYTAMYVKQDGRWQAVAEQANLLPEQ